MSRFRRRRTWWIIGAVIAVTLVPLGAVGLGGGPDTDRGVPRASATVEVQRRNLVEKLSVDGTLGYGPETPVGVRVTGTVTWLPPAGSTVSRNQTLLRVDDQPVTLLYGELPMYRRIGLAQSSSSPPPTAASAAKGRDVRQLEQNLAALGYTGFTVDDTFTAQTAGVVKRWQRVLGRPETGAVEEGDVFYAGGPVRIGRILSRVGAATGGDLLTYTATTRVVTVNVAVGTGSWAAKGTPVQIGLPDGRTVAGTVASVGTSVMTAEPAGGGEATPTIPVVVDIADPSAVESLDASPVTVSYVVERHADVLAVPVAALVALAEGGYGLEVVDGSASHFVAVEVGLFADGFVEVSGPQLREQMTVRMPA